MTSINTRISTAISLIVVLATTAVASPVFVDDEGRAVRGYDPVAYFEVGEPVQGSPAFSYRWQDADWLFSSEANRQAFVENPQRYAPQYGGHCAYAVSLGKTASTAPDAWTIRQDKLYLNYSRNVRVIWSRDIPGNIRKADANWPALRDE